ncbi:M16 family metallopeptidase [Treponema sp. R6D11]
MTKTKKIKDGVNLYFLESNEFKTNRIVINFHAALEKEAASYGALLSALLVRANKKIPTTLELEHTLSELYGARIFSGYTKHGDGVCYSFGIDILKDKYAGEPVEEKGLEILADCVLHQDDFNEEYFFQEKQNQINSIHAKANDKKELALTKLIELMAPDEPYSVCEDGDIDVISGIELEDLIDFYDYKFLKLPCDIICSGEFDIDKTTKKISEIFDNYIVETASPRSSYHEFVCEKNLVEKEELSQSKLALGFVLGEGTHEEKTIFNAIFGATPYSKLFVNVREKMSLCYYVSSKISLFKNVMVVESGINSSDFEKAKKEILVQLEAVSNGSFDEKDIDDAKRAVLQSLKSGKAGQASREQMFIKDLILGRELDEQALANVGRDAIANVAKGARLEATYLMENK